MYSRAFLVVSAKEHRLSPVVTDPFAFLSLRVPALSIAAKNTSLKVLYLYEKKKQNQLIVVWQSRIHASNRQSVRNLICMCRKITVYFFYFFQPIRIWQRRVGKRVLPLHIVPRRSNVVVPRDYPFHGVPHQVYVDGFGQVKSIYSYSGTRKKNIYYKTV